MVLRMAKYLPLREHLERTDGDAVSMSFDAVADLVGGLPASAYKYTAWWANDRTHPNAVAWLDAGRRVTDIDLARRRVRFSARASAKVSPPNTAPRPAAVEHDPPRPVRERVPGISEAAGEDGFTSAGFVTADRVDLVPAPPPPGRTRHQYGAGPFAALRMPPVPDAPGVYLWLLDGAPVYVGRTITSLRGRLGSNGYATISTYNTLAAQPGRSNGGQQTNCRIDALANAALGAGGRIEIRFRITDADRAAGAEQMWMRSHGVPDWNARDER